VRFAPFQRTIDPLTKPLPVAVRVNAEPPAEIELGDRLVSDGTGLPPDDPIVNVWPFEMPPPGVGFWTVTVAVPALATSAAAIAAVKRVGETKVVVRAVPFQRTVELGTKFVPLTVNVKAALPALVEFGAKLETVGAGFVPSKLVREKLS
jgi:hypothetical protein